MTRAQRADARSRALTGTQQDVLKSGIAVRTRTSSDERADAIIAEHNSFTQPTKFSTEKNVFLSVRWNGECLFV